MWITEVAPRDGLQNEKCIVPTQKKIEFINFLARTGVQEIEVGSFVSSRIPQMADTGDVLKGLEKFDGVLYSVLIPNEKGLSRALQYFDKIDKIAVFTASSETFNNKNINMTIKESYIAMKPVIKEGKSAGKFVRGYVSTAFWCPYEGKIPPSKTASVVEDLLALGVDEVSCGDTIGRASPRDVENLLEEFYKRGIKMDILAMHFHNTYGMGVANVIFSFRCGIRKFDSSAGGLGGCPFAPGAAGNVPTEDIVFALLEDGADLKVDIRKVVESLKILGFEPRSYISKVFGYGSGC